MTRRLRHESSELSGLKTNGVYLPANCSPSTDEFNERAGRLLLIRFPSNLGEPGLDEISSDFSPSPHSRSAVSVAVSAKLSPRRTDLLFLVECNSTA